MRVPRRTGLLACLVAGGPESRHLVPQGSSLESTTHLPANLNVSHPPDSTWLQRHATRLSAIRKEMQVDGARPPPAIRQDCLLVDLGRAPMPRCCSSIPPFRPLFSLRIPPSHCHAALIHPAQAYRVLLDRLPVTPGEEVASEVNTVLCCIVLLGGSSHNSASSVQHGMELGLVFPHLALPSTNSMRLLVLGPSSLEHLRLLSACQLACSIIRPYRFH